MKEINLKVEGMMCTGCENRIQNAVKNMNGIKSVKADHTTGTVKIEAEDGIETLKIIYDYTYKKNERISAIISDETMKLLSGVQTAEVLEKIFSIIDPIPFYLVTAYEGMRVNSKTIKN